MRSDTDVFWHNRIPVPAVLVKTVFFSGEKYLKNYCAHLLSGIVLALSDISNELESELFGKFPDPEAVKNDSIRGTLVAYYNECQNIENFKDFENQFTKLCGMGAFELSADEMLQTLSHKGKKYDRIYIPDIVQQMIQNKFPKVLNLLSGGNGDMFGNIVADDLNIYRSGFADAFAAIFNRYLEFKFVEFPDVDPRSAHHGQMERISVSNIGGIKPVDYADGSLWSPNLEQGGLIGVEIEKDNPIWNLEPEEQIRLLILALSKEEMSIFNEEKKQAVEELRFKTSSTLKEFIKIQNG